MILSGIIGLVIGDYGMLKSYEIIGSRLGMLMMSFVPPISVVLAYLFLGEVLSLVIWGAILGPYLSITASLMAVANTQVGIASTLMATVPLLMLPISKFYYKEKLSITSILGTIVAVSGIAIIFLN